jgi:hypothetical protein
VENISARLRPGMGDSTVRKIIIKFIAGIICEKLFNSVSFVKTGSNSHTLHKVIYERSALLNGLQQALAQFCVVNVSFVKILTMKFK